jgi:hypothetical protein
VYETALQDVPKLRRECLELLRESEDVEILRLQSGIWK